MANDFYIDLPVQGGGGGSGTVTSVGLTAVPTSVFNVSGSPVTTSGTLALSMDNQAANIVLAGPATGADAAPSFRALVTADMPAGTGTVTSVALTAAPTGIFDVSGSPITGSGTLAISMDNQNANIVLAGPTTGGAATPSFRSLVAADIPVLPYAPTALTSAHIFVGNGSNIATDVAMTGDISITNAGVTAYAGTVPVTKGGTGLTTLTANNVVLGNGTSTPGFVAPSTSGNVLTSNGTTWTSAAPSSGTAWTSYSPTASWTTNTTVTGYYAYINGTLYLSVKFAITGQPDNTAPNFDLPSGYTVNTTAFTNDGSNYFPGSVSYLHTGISQFSGWATYQDTNTIKLDRFAVSGAQISMGATDRTTPFTWQSGDFIFINIWLPATPP